MAGSLPITAIILTFNEENKIRDCLHSVYGFCNQIFVVDSGSTDQTLQIAREYDSCIYEHPFENYASQRNWALDNLPIKNDWVLNLDADHRLTDTLKQELRKCFENGLLTNVHGFLIRRKTIFKGRWIKHGGHYPTYHAVLFKKQHGRCENRLYDQHFIVEGETLKIKRDIEDIVVDEIDNFIFRHNRWSTLEATYIVNGNHQESYIYSNAKNNAIRRRRIFKHLYYRFPLFIRPFIYFFYRYFLRLGFLDGKEGLIFHVLQGFWFRFLVDVKIWELRRSSQG
jgi:glycosyltransferase involved in cell wall biosynthesis